MTSERQKHHGYELPERIGGHDLICASLMIPNAPEYIRAFRGALRTLSRWENWRKTYQAGDTRAAQAASYWRELLEEHLDIGGCGFEDTRTRCVDYPTQAPFIDYAPQNPFTEPGKIPDGYIGPAWRVVESGMLQIVGLNIGDVITGYDGAPVLTPALGSGLARFRVNVVGTGRMILTLLAIPLGGAVLITVDGSIDPTKAVLLELERDLVSVPPETVVEILQEVEISGAGEHYVDVSFLPRFNDSLSFIGYGGGLRKVTLCGLCPKGSPNCGDSEQSMLLRQNPFDSCSLQQSLDNGATWVEIFNSRQCAVDTVKDMNGTRDINGGTEPEPEQCFDLDLVVQANAMRLIPLPVQSGWTLTLSQVNGAWNDGNLGHDWVCPNGHAYFFGQCSPLVEGVQGSDPVPTQPHMKLIIRLPDGTYEDIPQDGTSYVVPEGQPEGNTFLLANDSVLSDNQGSVSLHLVACNTALHCYVWDFALSDCGFTVGGFQTFGADPEGRAMGQYSDYWHTSDNQLNTGYWDRAVSIHRSFSEIPVYKLELEYDYGASSGNWGVVLFKADSGALAVTHTDGTAQVLTWNGREILSGIGAQSWPHGSNDAPNGIGAIRSLKIYTTSTIAPEGSVACE